MEKKKTCKVEGVVYVEATSDLAISYCSGCAGENDDVLCEKLAVCSDIANDHDFIWVKKK